MNKLGRRLAVAGLCICMATVSLTGCSKLNGTAAVATLDGENVELGLVNLLLRYNQAQMESSYGAMFGDDMWNSDLTGSGTSYGTTFKSQMMESVEEMLILEKHMTEYEVSLSDEEKADIKEAAKKFMEENSADTIAALTATQDTVERMLTLYTIKTKMSNAIIKDVDTEVSDDEAAQKTISYVLFSTADTTDAEGNTTSMTDDEKAAVKEKAQNMLDAVKGGKTMEDALKEIDEEMSVSSGSYGTDDTVLKDELKTAGDKLKDGETADSLVEADGGYYVVQMKSTFDQDATDSKKASIVSQRKSDKYTEVYTAWKDAAKFEIKENVWKKVTFADKMTVKQTEAVTEEGTEAGTGTTQSETVTTSETTSETTTEQNSETGTDNVTEKTSESGTSKTTEQTTEPVTEKTSGTEAE